MGVYIKGMEMPKSEEQCKFFQPAPFRAPYCAINGVCHGIEDCPLVPVPPHGDLIEESKVLDIVSEWCPDDDGSVGKVDDLREMLDEIEALPTIIPAEEVFEKYTDTAGNLHWTGTHSGEHTIKAEED